MKYSIYIYEGDLSSSDLRENLMTDAVIAYCGTHDIGYADVTVERAEKGKPYIYGTEGTGLLQCFTQRQSVDRYRRPG